MLEEHITNDGKKYYFNVETADYLEHEDINKCIVIKQGFLIVICTPYETMKAKKRS